MNRNLFSRMDEISGAMPSARAGRASHRVSVPCLGHSATIAIAAMSLAACAPDQRVDCVNIATGETLTDTDNTTPREMGLGFSGTDAQGFTHTVRRQEAQGWKCHYVPRDAK